MRDSCAKGLGELSSESEGAAETLGIGCSRKYLKIQAVGTLKRRLVREE